MNKHYLRTIGLCLCLYGTGSFAGILAEKTRVIYPQGQREVSLRLNNTNDYPIMTQFWVDHGVGDPDTAKAPFLVLNPMFQLKAAETKGIRIILTQPNQVTDRESLYWLNMYEIPAVSAQGLTENHVNLSMNTQMKLIYRPTALKAPIWEDIQKQLKFQIEIQGSETILTISNPSNYYISMGSLKIFTANAQQRYGDTDKLMIEPQKTQRFKFETTQAIQYIEYSLIDDDGHHLAFKHIF